MNNDTSSHTPEITEKTHSNCSAISSQK